ncbi:helix-turn-helix transcriptional regulator [Adlercreutzia caecimuris]|uniref:Helix-turn-helix transcriptional regulator n=1 Tax=Adlercreutzia caecimuris TaxID=671266 RepID=A0A4S4G1P5_9ACTN|nr:helix-turn-helix transcriptional regulator [Adlercreutzia caecimuris]NBJ67424.1 XRE family transcriptional regulator [Adlercreutzia caecimuris]THG36442.1 helix-turn-helix transcriptional regulator [Adlercreutzia caecimuris]
MLKDNLRKYREQKGLSQEQLADEVHVVRQTVSKWERGKSVPDASMLVELTRALGVTAADLLGESVVWAQSQEELALEAGLLKERVSQKDRSERIYRWSVAALAVACAVVLAASVVYALANEAGKFASGFEHGFKLEGTWASERSDQRSTYLSFGFADDEGGVWQLARPGEGTPPVNGYFRKTGDPNVYVLLNEEGQEVGWAHVAFTSSFGGNIDGLAYVQYQDTCYQVRRMDDFVDHYAQDYSSVWGVMADRAREGAAEGIQGSDDWLKEWFAE